MSPYKSSGRDQFKRSCPDALDAEVVDVVKAVGEGEEEEEGEGEGEGEVKKEDESQVVEVNQADPEAAACPILQEYLHGNIQVQSVVTTPTARVSLHQASANEHDVHHNQQEYNYATVSTLNNTTAFAT